MIQVEDREDFECSQFSGSFVADAKIEKVFKDNTGLDLSVGETVSISSSLFGNLCGYSLTADNKYIVFARATGAQDDETDDEDETEKVCSSVSHAICLNRSVFLRQGLGSYYPLRRFFRLARLCTPANSKRCHRLHSCTRTVTVYCSCGAVLCDDTSSETAAAVLRHSRNSHHVVYSGNCNITDAPHPPSHR